MKSKVYYTAFLDLTGKKCVIVGGGKVAERKCLSLIRAGALITVIAPEITKRLRAYKDEGVIKHTGRDYRKGDIAPAYIVISATGSRETNERVARDAQSLNKLINVVDTPDLCNFIVPSVFRRGMLSIAVSTGGVSPALAKEIRKELAKIYRPEISKKLEAIGKMRDRAKKEITGRKEREKFIKKATSAIRKGDI
ncbi:MAG TPA: bifunctional precorrin-2 dehydrogenase/sirohydrochlorin ferrochelatase [Candidatus Brocadiales bacterium]|nr:bifunctional precorrin-2 dehydrogenase/sirohydrochlorin ferrochelatase [Candidatus Brocadiales bacterium]